MVFSHKVLSKYEVQYYHCTNCNSLQTEDPFWLKEAYENSITEADTGILGRNIGLSRVTAILLTHVFGNRGQYLDYAGGYGILVRLMRDEGFDFFWTDKYCDNLFAKGYEYNDEVIDLITCFEAFEHYANPIGTMEEMLAISPNVFFSTELITRPVPELKEWVYLGPEHGQHVTFYSVKTLQFIANRFHLNLYTNGLSLHLFTKRKINPWFFRILLSWKGRRFIHFFTRHN